MANGQETAASTGRTTFGRLRSGEAVEAIVLRSPEGMALRVLTYGAAIQSLELPGPGGTRDEVVLGYSELEPYVARPEFFGAVVGRFANRIGGGGFSLDGERHALATNEGDNVLHGGADGFHRVTWEVAGVRGGQTPSMTLVVRSPHGDQGFPGAVEAAVTYTLNENLELQVAFEATTTASTVVSLTSHPYFNLSGTGSGRDILGHTLELAADAYTPIDGTMIPTGEVRDVSGTPFDFRAPRSLGDAVRSTEDPQVALVGGIDHNFVLRDGASREPRFAARLTDPWSGRSLAIWTTEPGLQLYCGQKLGTGAAATKAVFAPCTGVALEPQAFPDAPNKPGFPSARLDPGQTYRHVSIYRFSSSSPR